MFTIKFKILRFLQDFFQYLEIFCLKKKLEMKNSYNGSNSCFYNIFDKLENYFWYRQMNYYQRKFGLLEREHGIQQWFSMKTE